ncbi:MAG: IS4 family transposase [Halanaerobium sp.]
MDKDITETTFNQLLVSINFNLFSKIVTELELDKYTKKLTTIRLFLILIYGQLESVSSLDSLSIDVSNKSDLKKETGLDSISASQLSRKLRDIPPVIFEKIFDQIKLEALAKRGSNFYRNNLGQLNIIDASTISMALSNYPWADFRSTKAGIKIHTRIIYDGDIMPDKVEITTAKGADKTKMDNLIVQDEDTLHVFDRAYVDYQKFDDYCDADILFLSRLKSNAKIKVLKSETVIINDQKVKDSTVFLGDKKQDKQMNNILRILEIPDRENPGSTVRLITNDFKHSAALISRYYRDRWQIEIFFKWIKQHLHVKVFYGHSENAVKSQIFTALISFVLLTLLKREANTDKSLFKVLKYFRACKFESLKAFIKKINRPPSRTSKGRRVIDYEKIYHLTERQVMAGDTELLYSTEFNPVVL